MSQNDAVRIVEVGPRDGLQNMSGTVATSHKIDLIRRLRQTGLNTIELTSIVSPRAVPQLKDSREVLTNPFVRELLADTSLRAPVLVANEKGLDAAISQDVKEVAVFVSAAEGFSKANIRCGVREGLDRARAVSQAARRNGLAVRGCIHLPSPNKSFPETNS